MGQIVIGSIAFFGFLYWWLLGHWFSRLIAFLVLTPMFVALSRGLATLAWGEGHPNLPLAFADMAVCGFLAWFASGLPLYIWRWQATEEANTREREALKYLERLPRVSIKR